MSGLHIECFHRVLPESEQENQWPYFARGTAMTVGAFDARLAELGRKYNFVDERGALDWLSGKGDDRPVCWITFDDGYCDNLEHAAPVAAAHGVRPTLFVTTCALGGDWWPPVDEWYAVLRAAALDSFLVRDGDDAEELDLTSDAGRYAAVTGTLKTAYMKAPAAERRVRLANLRAALGVERGASKPAFLSRSQLCELASMGWFVGPHGHEHQLLTALDEAAACEEIQRSVDALRTLLLENDSAWIAYSDGRYDERLIGAIERRFQANGYVGGLTIDGRAASRHDDPWAMPRFIGRG